MRLLLILLFLAVPALAADEPSVLTPEIKQAFIKAMMKSYDPKCKCAVYLYKGRVAEIKIPPSDITIHLMIDALKNGVLVPLENRHEGSPS